MKIFALPRVDGGVEVMYVVDGCDPAECIGKWSPKRRADITGEIKEITAVPSDRKYRNAWKVDGDVIAVDEVKKAEIDGA